MTIETLADAFGTAKVLYCGRDPHLQTSSARLQVINSQSHMPQQVGHCPGLTEPERPLHAAPLTLT